jgi:CBS domain-containing protein
LREQTVAALQKVLIESDTLVVLILDQNGGDVIGLVTLHDLLRAESALAQNAASDV